MPMRSQAQRSYLWLRHPELARKFEEETPKGKDLPSKLKEKGRSKRKRRIKQKVGVSS